MEPLSSRALELIRTVLTRQPEVVSATLFGSRAKGVHREASDIDLVLEGNISALQAEAIEAELEELSLPQTFDVCVIGRVPESVREHIARVGVPIFKNSASPIDIVRFGKGGTRKGVDLNSSSALLDIMDPTS